jgi:hypothetical protein
LEVGLTLDGSLEAGDSWETEGQIWGQEAGLTFDGSREAGRRLLRAMVRLSAWCWALAAQGQLAQFEWDEVAKQVRHRGLFQSLSGPRKYRGFFQSLSGAEKYLKRAERRQQDRGEQGRKR